MDNPKPKEFWLTSWSIDNKTTIYIFTFIITLAGLFTYNSLPKEQFPDIVVPTISVATIYPGTSPEDVENLITKPIEKQLKSVNGVKKVTSQSIADFSIVVVEFKTGIEVAVAKQRVNDAVDKSKSDLPTDLDKDPSVQEIDFSEFPIMQVNVAGNYDQARLKKYAEDLQDAIEGMPEITRADLIGALDREIQVNVDLYRMEALGISFGDIERALASENVNISGGELNVADVRRTLRVTGEFKKVEDVRNIIIRSARGNTVYLHEIAQVADDFAERQNYARLDGSDVLTLNVIKRSGENLIEASDKIIALVDQLKEEKFPEGLKISITGDMSEETRLQLADLVNSVIIGFVFVVLVLMFFMGTTNAIFVGLSVPLSILLAFLVMPGLDFTLNVIVMFSFLLALGIVVDDAIVVIENTHRILHKYPEKGVVYAAKEAAGEVFVPVLSGTLTTIAPFFPLLFWPGLVGEFMYFLPVTLIVTLFASLFVAFVINPVFAVDFMDQEDPHHPVRKTVLQHVKVVGVIGIIAIICYFAFGRATGNFMVLLAILYLVNYYLFNPLIRGFQTRTLPWFMSKYRSLLAYVIHGLRPVWFVLGTIGLLIASIFIFMASNPQVEFFPKQDPSFVYVYAQLPIGTDASVTDSVTKIIEKRVHQGLGEDKEIVKSVISNVGIGAGDPQNPDRVVAPHKGKVSVAFVSFEERVGTSTRQVLENVRKAVGTIPGVDISVEQEQNGPPTGKPINIEIAGEDFRTLKRLEKQVRDQLATAGIQGIEELRTDLQLNKPEIAIDIDRDKANREGISTAQIALQVRNALYGKEVSKFREGNDEYPIMVRVEKDDRDQIEKIVNMQISYLDMATGRFRQVPLNAVATVRYATTYSQINRKNQQRVVSLSSNVLGGYNANEIVAQINSQVIPQLDLPDGYTVKMTGEQEDQQETGNFLIVAFSASIMLIFMILVTQFNSLSKPFIIFSTIVLSLIGVLLGFALFHMTFSIVMTGVGIIALAGIVVKNGILLIEFTDELRGRGMETREAIIEAGATRLTPVLLTASAAVLGLIPLALGININFVTLLRDLEPNAFMGGNSAAFWGPLAWAIVFGLTFCTFLTLVIVPAQYWIIERIKTRYIRRQQSGANVEPAVAHV